MANIIKIKYSLAMIQTKGYAAQTVESDLAAWNFERREVGANDVQIEIILLWCMSFRPASDQERLVSRVSFQWYQAMRSLAV